MGMSLSIKDRSLQRHTMSAGGQEVEVTLEIASFPCVSVPEPFEEDIGGLIYHVQHIEGYPVYFVPRFGAR